MSTLTHASGQSITVPDETAAFYTERGWSQAGAQALTDDEASLPDGSWNSTAIKAYAADHAIDLGAAKNKDEYLAVITAAATEGEPDGADADEGGTVPTGADAGADDQG